MCCRMKEFTKTQTNNAKKETPLHPFNDLLPDGDDMGANEKQDIGGQLEAI